MSKTTSGGESIRQVTSGHQSRLILAVVCVASVMCATSAQAQGKVTRTQPINEQDATWGENNPCNGAFVNFQGHLREQTVSHSDGSYTSRIQQDGQSISSSDMKDYRFNYWAEQHFRSSTPNFRFTFQSRKHIISQGSGNDNYFVKERFTVSPTAPPSQSDKSVCSCGAPKSACP